MNLYVAWSLMFMGLILTRILFVSNNFSDAWYVSTTLFVFSNFRIPDLYYIDPYMQSFYIVLALGLAVGAKNSMEIAENFKPNTKYMFYTIILFTASLFTFSSAKEFLYFQF